MLLRSAQSLAGWRFSALLICAHAATGFAAVQAADLAGTGPGVWLPNGILAGGLLALRPKPALGLLVASVAVLVSLHLWRPGYYAPHFILMDLAVPIAVAALARRFCGAAQDLSRGKRLWRFAALAAAPPVVASAVTGAILSQSAFQQSEATLAGVWLLTDFFGVLLGAVAVLTFAKRDRTTPPGRSREAGAMVALTAGATVALIAFSQPIALIFPLLLLITFRLGAAYSAVSVAVFAAIATPLFLINSSAGVLNEVADPVARVGQLHLFVGLILLCTFPTFTALADRTRDRARLARQSVAARRARALAEAGDRAKSRFLAVMSHELRTPLGGISGAGELLAARTDLPPAAAAQVETLRNACAVLGETIEDILDYTRCETGEVDLVRERFSTLGLFDRTMAVLGRRAADKGVDLTFDAGPDGDRELLGDPRRLVQILLNLVANAIRFTDSGSVAVTAKLEAATGAQVWLVLEVRDTGVGFAPEALPSLFEPFTQADPGVWRTRGGSGLGLAICKTLLDQMGGSITASSRPGAGATFEVRTPVHRAQVDGVRPTEAARVALSGRVMVVEDEPLWRDLACLTLRQAGLEVVACETGVAAVEAAGRSTFDLVFMDICLPDLDGLGATEALRARDPEGRPTPIVALSAYTVLSKPELGSSGFSEVLSKPLKLSALLECAARYTTIVVPLETGVRCETDPSDGPLTERP